MMKMPRIRSAFLGACCLVTAYALAYTTGPCQTQYPKCDLTKEGAQCASWPSTDTISFGDQESLAIYYCGGNTAGRCSGPNSTGTCSELYYRPGTARAVFCGENLLGYCWDSVGNAAPTGYDCGLHPCPD